MGQQLETKDFSTLAGKKRSVGDTKLDGKMQGAKRHKGHDVTDPVGLHKNKGFAPGMPVNIRPYMQPNGSVPPAATGGATFQHASGPKGLGLANGLGGSIPVPAQGNLTNVAGGLMSVPPPHIVSHQLLGQAGFSNSMVGLSGNHNQIKAFLDQISLGQYWRLLSENGCDTLEDLATADVQMLVNLGFKIFHANRLVTAVQRIIRPTAAKNTPSKRKRASHVRTFAEMYQRVQEFQTLVEQVGSMSAAERDPRSTISRGAYTQYLRIKDLAEKAQINLTSEKYANIKPTEKNVRDIITKEKGSSVEENGQVSAGVGVPPTVGTSAIHQQIVNNPPEASQSMD
eukprot:CAMPEP_0114500046 /NCGR_PEP_ID=MMETSP0109-20121206/7747_1 /TAXON_ID=29199 /ORGANISM="Chlorarachnion reptans, Strain CCCM449" /LENGTH=341 /DNA_ID=CAMNT_0001677665 /DNA_START=307 /DNA_END=1332 /DNA_ORIENTATION=-